MSIDWVNTLLDVGIDIPIDRPQVTIQCPFHDDTHDSCSINTDDGKWICFRGCGQGSLRTFVQRILGLDKLAVDKYLMDKSLFLDIDMFDSISPPVNGKLPEVTFPHTAGQVPWWIFDRGFTKKTLKYWECGVDNYNNLIIPIKDRDARLVGWVTRQYNREPKYLYSKGLQKSKVLFGEDKLKKVPFVCITEGSLDTIWLNQCGYSSVAILGSMLSLSQQEALIKLSTDELVLCLDNDEAGRLGTDRAMACISKRFVVSYVKLPKGFKDVQDIRDKNVLEEVINNRTFW
tara:strand:+ start:578 stop:1444 length:867 start_codon:yes stop_codon:yes gene_type:complete